MPAEFKPGVYRHRFSHSLATAALSEEPGYVRFDWPTGEWDQWPLDSYLKDWRWEHA